MFDFLYTGKTSIKTSTPPSTRVHTKDEQVNCQNWMLVSTHRDQKKVPEESLAVSNNDQTVAC